MTDLTRALSEIERRAVRTDLRLWTHERPNPFGPKTVCIVECICIPKDRLIAALKEVYGDDSVLDPEPSQHTP